MAATVFIQYSETDDFQWITKEISGEISAPARGDIDSLVAACHGHSTIVVLPGTSTLLTEIVLPTRSRHKILQALPYALEDQFIEDIDNLHFAIPSLRKSQDEIPVCAVSRDTMAKLLSRFGDAGIQLHAVISAIHALPCSSGEWSVLIEENLVTARTGIFSGFSLDTACLTEIFEILLPSEEQENPSHIRILDARSEEEMASAWLPGNTEHLSIDMEPLTQLPIQLFAQHYLPEQSINLLQGEFSIRRRRFELSRKWIPVAALVLLSVGLQLGSWISEYVQLSKKLAVQQKQIESIFHQAVPDARRIVNPRAQMQKRLDELQQGAGSHGDNYLGMMAKAGGILSQQKDLVIHAIQYRNQELDIELVVRDLQSLDVLKQQLLKTGMQVEIRSASASSGQVNGRIRLKENI